MLHTNRKKRKILRVFFASSHFFAIRIQLNVSIRKVTGKLWIFIGVIIFRGNSVQKYETIISKKVEKYLQNWEVRVSIGVYMDSYFCTELPLKIMTPMKIHNFPVTFLILTFNWILIAKKWELAKKTRKIFRFFLFVCNILDFLKDKDF
jgi:hypothetical protein